MSKSITDKVKELEKHNRLLTENLIDAVWVINAETLKYEYITPSIEKISGFTPNEYIDKSIQDHMTPEAFEKGMVVLAEAMKGFAKGKKSFRTLELELIHKKGGTFWIEIRGSLTKEGKEPIKIVGISRDITTKKRAEQQQEELNRKLTEALAEKERLLNEIKVLKELLPICSGCKRIRDEEGKWWPMDAYIKAHTDSDFTHTICPDCKDVFYPDLKK